MFQRMACETVTHVSVTSLLLHSWFMPTTRELLSRVSALCALPTRIPVTILRRKKECSKLYRSKAKPFIFLEGFQGEPPWRRRSVPTLQRTPQSSPVVAWVPQHQLRWYFVPRAQDRSSRGPSGKLSSGT